MENVVGMSSLRIALFLNSPQNKSMIAKRPGPSYSGYSAYTMPCGNIVIVIAKPVRTIIKRIIFTRLLYCRLLQA